MFATWREANSGELKRLLQMTQVRHSREKSVSPERC